MSPVPDGALQAFLSTVDRFAQTEIDALAFDRAHSLPSRVLEGLAELGVFGLAIPERYGGAELGAPGACAVVDRLARHDRGVATTVGLHNGLGTRPLVAYGSESLKTELLPGMAAGETLAAFATTESGAGSDLMAIATRARAHGERLRVSGEKIFVTNGRLADVITITASTPGLGGVARGHSMIVLRGSDAGLSRGAEEDKLGLRASSTCSIVLDDVDLPASRVVGEPGRGKAQLNHVLAWGRTVLAAGCNGTAWAAVQRALAHTASRRQFGRPLAAQPLVREQLADMAARLFAMQALVERTALQADDEAALSRGSLCAKVFCSDGDWEICDTTLQLFGGSGYIEDTGIPLLLRDARITRIFEGANDVLLTHLGMMEAVGAPARTAWSEDPVAIHNMSIGALAEPADALADRVAERRADWVSRHGMKLMRQPRLLHRLGRLAMLRASTDAAVERALRLQTPRAQMLAERWLVVAGDGVDVVARERASTTDVEPLVETLLGGLM